MENVTYTNELNANAAVVADGMNAQFKPATATAPAGFAITLHQDEVQQLDVHKLGAALPKEKLASVTDDLIQRRKTWEEGAFKSSNRKLNALLADTLGLNLHILKFDDARTDFNKLYKTSGLESTKSTSLTTKVVRFVFGGKAKNREFAYAKAITIAIEAGIQPENFAQFVEDNGGLEELRRNGVKAGSKRQDREAKIDLASAVLKTSTPLAQQLPAPADLKLEGPTNFVAAIMRKESDGTLSLLHVSAKESLIDALLEHAAADVKQKADSDNYVTGRTAAIADNQ